MTRGADSSDEAPSPGSATNTADKCRGGVSSRRHRPGHAGIPGPRPATKPPPMENPMLSVVNEETAPERDTKNSSHFKSSGHCGTDSHFKSSGHCGRDSHFKSAQSLSGSDENCEAGAEEKCGQSMKAPDGGYGWFIVLGSFLLHVLTSGLGRSDGLFFLLYRGRFNQSATLTAWPIALAGVLRMGMGPIASALCQRWSGRACCLIGALGLGLVQILNAFSPNFSVLFVSHGFLYGLSRGLVFAPSMILVNTYFDSKRSFATGLSSSGVGMGTLLMVPLIQFLFDHYGFTGGFLLLGGVCLHCAVIAMIFRPLFLHYKFLENKRAQSERRGQPEMMMMSTLAEAAETASLRSVRLRNSFSVGQDVRKDLEETQDLIKHHHNLNTSSSSLDIQQESCSNSSITSCSSTLSLPVQSPSHNKDSFWKSTFDIIFPRDMNLQRNPTDGRRQRAKLFHFELLREPAFLGFCLSLSLFTATSKSTFVFMPALAKSRGLTGSDAVFILSVSGAVDTGGRILAGFLLDTPVLRKWRLLVYGCSQVLLSCVCALMPMVAGSFLWLCVACSLFGVLSGLLASQRSVVCVDLLDAERMPGAFGILLMFQAVGIGFGPLISGFFRDAFGRFHEAFYLGAALMGLSACLMVYSTVRHSQTLKRQS